MRKKAPVPALWGHPILIGFAATATLFLLVTLAEPRLVGRFFLATLVLAR